MNEQAPQSEKKYGEMVPEYVFDKTWQEANFIVPTNDNIRKELREKLEGFTHYGVMNLPENQKAMKILEARVAAIDAYDAKMPKAKERVSNKIESRKERIAALSAELVESNEMFPFPGVNPESYAKLKTDIEHDKEMSLYDYSSPTLDELIKRFQNEGMRVTFGDTPKAGNVYIVPAGSNEKQPSRPEGLTNMVMQSDNFFPRHLQPSAIKYKLEELAKLRIQTTSFRARD